MLARAVDGCNGEKRVSNDEYSIKPVCPEFAVGDWRDRGTTNRSSSQDSERVHIVTRTLTSFVPNADVPLNYSTQLRPSSTPPRRLPAAAGPAEINFSKHDLMGNIKMPSCITKAQGEQVELRGGAKGRGGEGGKCRRRRRPR